MTGKNRAGKVENVELIERAIRSNGNVLITGETGTGKSSLARVIHEKSARSLRPFVSVNLATLHEGTFESELFGHEKGAFTGADRKRVGRLEQANGGTVFLDEIGEISQQMQSRLLDFLQSKTIIPVGNGKEIKLDVRIIVATNRDLTKAVQNGEFREDLFHRLRVLQIDLKPLRKKCEDEFNSLVHKCLERNCRIIGRRILKISSDVANVFETYSWPGNIRELNNVLESSLLASDGPELLFADLPDWFTERSREGVLVADQAIESLNDGEFYFRSNMNANPMAEALRLEGMIYKHNFIKSGLRINLTAKCLKINRTTLTRRMKRCGLVGEWWKNLLVLQPIQALDN